MEPQNVKIGGAGPYFYMTPGAKTVVMHRRECGYRRYVTIIPNLPPQAMYALCVSQSISGKLCTQC